MARALDFFTGSGSAPSRPHEVAASRPILGTGERPPKIVDRMSNYTLYLPRTDRGEPRISVERVEGYDDEVVAVDLPVVDGQYAAHLRGRSGTRESFERIREGIDESIGSSSHRPEWVDASFAPRLSPGRHYSSLRRFNGRPVEPLEVFGGEDRVEFLDAAWPWGLVESITNSRGQSGSAVLVGDRTIITAGHVAPWGDSPWWMQFTPAFYDGLSLHGAGVTSYVSDYNGYDAQGEVAGYDYVVCRLYEPLGNWLGFMGYNGYSEDWNDQTYWSIIGYPGAIAMGNRPSYQSGISVWDVDNESNGGRELESQTADLTPGNSGGPMFGWWSGDPRVVGVVSGAESDYSFPFSSERSNVMAGGPAMTDLIAWARTTWPL